MVTSSSAVSSQTLSLVSVRFSPELDVPGVRLRKHLSLHVAVLILWRVCGLLVLVVVLVFSAFSLSSSCTSGTGGRIRRPAASSP